MTDMLRIDAISTDHSPVTLWVNLSQLVSVEETVTGELVVTLANNEVYFVTAEHAESLKAWLYQRGEDARALIIRTGEVDTHAD